MPLRILHISTRLILGGSQENTILSCEGQSALGHDVHLAFGPIYGPEGSMLERVQTHGGITPHVVPALVREVHPWKDLRAYLQLRRLIATLRPHIVHTHSSKAGILGRGAAWGARVPSPAPGGAGDSRAPADGGGLRDERLGEPSHRLPAIVHTIHGPPFHRHESAHKNRMYIAAERWAAKRCHRIVSVADAMTAQFLEAGIGTPERYTTVRSGIDLAPYEHARTERAQSGVRRELGLAADDVVIGTVARLADLKGHDDVLDALGDTLRERPNLRLLWVGDGWRRGALTARLVEMGLRDRVVLAGLVPPERVPAMLGAMDVLVHPSYREGLPRCVVQAMAVGVPVVATDVDGTREVVIDQETGRLVPAGDAGALREAVRWMLADRERRDALAGAALDRIVPGFAAARMVADLERVYEEALRCAHDRDGQ